MRLLQRVVIPECFYRGSSFSRRLESGFRLKACRNDDVIYSCRRLRFYVSRLFFLSFHPSLFTCGVLAMASESGGTSLVTVVPAAISELRPIVTGATNCTSLPTKTSS